MANPCPIYIGNIFAGRRTPLPGPSRAWRNPGKSRFFILTSLMAQAAETLCVRVPIKVHRWFGDRFGATSCITPAADRFIWIENR